MRLLAAIVLVLTAFPAFAQAPIAPPPVRQVVDENGVDVLRGRFVITSNDLSIGTAQSGLAYRTFAYDGSWSDDQIATLDQVGNIVTVTLDGASDSFTALQGTYSPNEGNGASLAMSGANLIYTNRYGTIATFLVNNGDYQDYYAASLGRVSKVARPDGYVEDFLYQEEDFCGSGWENGVCPSGLKIAWRLQAVTNNKGYRLGFGYAYNGSDLNRATYASWTKLVAVGVSNLNVAGGTNLATSHYDTVRDSDGRVTRTVTDPLNRVTTFKFVFNGPLTIKRAGTTAPNVTVSYGEGGVATVTREGVVHNYSYADIGPVRTTTVSRPDGSTRVYVGNTTTYLLSSFRDELNRLTSYTYDAKGRVTEIVNPEGDKIAYTYDARGNVTEARRISKTPGTPPDIVTSASFPATCANRVTCNRPEWTRDANGKQTDYTYDSTTGQLLIVTSPAASSGGVRPQTRYGYTAIGPLSMLTGTSACRTTASCSGGPDEVKSSIGYDVNLQPSIVSHGAGDNSLVATTAITYDARGNVASVDGPLSSAADTTRLIYDAARQPLGVIGPDPDGAGLPMKHRAARLTYNTDGQVTLTERGTTNGQNDGDWAAFAPLQSVATIYDGNARKISDKLLHGGTAESFVQYGYDARGRLTCLAQRMNVAAFGLQTDACALGTQGGFGPDRLTQYSYDAANQRIDLGVAFGTPEFAVESRLSWTGNGLVKTVKDGNGNLTTFEYDGFDRLLKQRYPSATVPGTSSTTDFDGFAYDPNANVTVRTLRDGQTIGYSYDDLDRVIFKDVPSGVSGEHDIDYTYDLFGRSLDTSDTTGGGLVQLRYDALGRIVSESALGLTKTMDYDLAGRMTRLAWPNVAGSPLVIDYDRLVTGEVRAIRENGATGGVGVLAGYGYDNLGRRTSVTRGNGVSSSYSYGSSPWITGLGHDASGTGSDVAWTFSYNPSGQIIGSTRDNDAYAYGAFANRDEAEVPNGLNQLVTQGGVTLGYDARANVSAIGATTFAFSSEDRLRAVQPAGPGIGMLYDPVGRLYQTTRVLDVVRFDTLGPRILGEMTETGTTLRRYVPGPGPDETLLWYEGAGLSNKRWLLADALGSTVGIADGSGAVTAKLAYDDYGIPAAGNVGRFQYTGQAWVPEIGMAYYKARIYAPAIGRFMQPDPMGYEGGMNLYAYVGGDPVNLTDPTGMVCEPCHPNEDIVVTGRGGGLGGGGAFGGSVAPGGAGTEPGRDEVVGETIVVTGIQLRFHLTAGPTLTSGMPQIQLPALDLAESVRPPFALPSCRIPFDCRSREEKREQRMRNLRGLEKSSERAQRDFCIARGGQAARDSLPGSIASGLAGSGASALARQGLGPVGAGAGFVVSFWWAFGQGYASC